MRLVTVGGAPMLNKTHEIIQEKNNPTQCIADKPLKKPGCILVPDHSCLSYIIFGAAAGYLPLMAVKTRFYRRLSMTNTSKGVAAFNGKEKKCFATNSVAMAFPTNSELVVLTGPFASSTVAYWLR